MQFHQIGMRLKENQQSQIRLTPQLAELDFAERVLLRAIRRIAATHYGPVLVYPLSGTGWG